MRLTQIFLLLTLLYIPFLAGQKAPETYAKTTIYGMYVQPLGEISKQGCAQPGFGFGFDYEKPVFHSFSWVSDMSFSLNGADDSKFTSSDAKIMAPSIEAVTIAAAKKSISSDNYLMVWGLTGLNYDYSLFESNSIHVDAQIGLLVSKMPEINIAVAGGADWKQSAVVNTALAYSAQIGYKYHSVNIGLHYYAATPKYKVTVLSGPQRFTSYTDLKVSFVSLSVGIII